MARHKIGKTTFWSDRVGNPGPRTKHMFEKTGFGSDRRVKGATYDPKSGKVKKK